MYTITTPNGTTGKVPEGLHEVTLAQYIQFAQGCTKRMPKVLTEYLKAAQAFDEEVEREYSHKGNRGRTREQIAATVSRTELDAAIEERDRPEHRIAILEYEAWCVSFWSGIALDELLGYTGESMQLNELRAIYHFIMNRLNPSEDVEYSNVLEVDGELWYLPAKYMQDGTVIEYLEASEFQMRVNKLVAGQWSTMAEIMCILVKKEGEKYHKDLMDRKQMFLGWTMDKVWAVAFFLMTRIERLSLASLTYIRAQQLVHLKQELKHSTSSTDVS